MYQRNATTASWLSNLPPITDAPPANEGEEKLPEIARFYLNLAPDCRGRTLAEILVYTDRQLEFHHDYIQMLFPLPEPSPYSRDAPTLDPATVAAFRCSAALRAALRTSVVRMLKFLGFECASGTDEPVKVVGDEGEGRSFWRRRFDHNHLRITRIIRCLRILGCEGDAREVYRLVSGVRGVGAGSLGFWRRAVGRGLEVLPDRI